jgi:hypothetical protein
MRGQLTGYVLDDRGSIYGRDRDFSICHQIQAGFGSHLSSSFQWVPDAPSSGKIGRNVKLYHQSLARFHGSVLEHVDMFILYSLTGWVQKLLFR